VLYYISNSLPRYNIITSNLASNHVGTPLISPRSHKVGFTLNAPTKTEERTHSRGLLLYDGQNRHAGMSVSPSR
jgi:hypothetical protein